MSLYIKPMGIIGIGNAGSQVAHLAESTIGEIVDSVYINTSDADLSMVGDSNFKFKIGENVEGSGKNRDVTKQHLRTSIMSIIKNTEFQDLIVDKKYVFVIASAAGGTGSGAAPVLFKTLSDLFPDVNFILIGILPQLNSSLLEQINTLEYLDELYNKLPANTTYMMYDNEVTKDMSSTRGLVEINKNIVEDIRILSGVDNFPTPFESIDEADMENIITTPGRLMVTRVISGLTEKTMEDNQIDDLIIRSIKSSMHCEINRDKKILRCGIVTFFTEQCNNLYNSSLDKLLQFIGTPAERFNHNAINKGNETMNKLYFISSGLSMVNDRINRINNRVKELEDALKAATDKKETGIDSEIISDMKRLKNNRDKHIVDVDIDKIFNNF